ncbi:unnamed protein product [Closterium sp. Naga37s-1]|nr:unnamed protein product [Closterium sp. Naga37s-1]
MDNTIPLTDAQKALLEGCDKAAVVKLVGARMWWRRRKWGKVVQELDAKKKRVRKTPSSKTRGKKRRTNVMEAGDGDVETMGSDGAGTGQTEPERNAGPDLKENEAQSVGASGNEDEDVGDEGKEGDEGNEGDAEYVEETEGLKTTEATQQRDYSDAEESESAQSASKGESDEGQAKTKTVEHVLSRAQNATKRGNDKPLDVEGDDPLVALRASPEGSRNPTKEVTVSRAVFDSLKRAQDDNAKTVARLEEILLKALAKSPVGSHRRKAEKQRDPGLGCANPKRRRVEARSDASEGDEDDESDDSRRHHMRSSRSPVLQSALDLLPADKAWKRICDLVRVYLFLSKPFATMTFYQSSDDKTDGVCAVLDRLPYSYACLALAADKSRRADFNKTLSEWKTRAAARVRDIALPKLGLFRDERDASSPWALEKERSAEKIRGRIGLAGEGEETLALSNWSNDRQGMPFASAAFVACAKAAFKPKKPGVPLTLNVYHLAWLEHVVTDAVMYWEERKGRLSNSAGGNGHVVNRLKVLAKGAVERAIGVFNPEWDAERQAWISGRHGMLLRLVVSKG